MDLIFRGRTLNQSINPDWELVNVDMLPGGYRKVGTVDRPDGTIEDLGQNADGNFMLFRRSSCLETPYSHEKGRKLSPIDLQGFGLSPDQSVDDVNGDGQYSGLCKSNLVGAGGFSIADLFRRK